MWTFVERIEGQEMWPRRRALPGPGGLRWHMSARSDRGPALGDLGLLIGEEAPIRAMMTQLQGLRNRDGIASEVRLVEVQQ